MLNAQSPIINKHLHYLILIIVIILGAILRFGNLDFKPLWMDEVITTIFSLGKNYQDLPLDTTFPLTKLTEIFTYKPGISCAQIAENISSQSTHPPLFFCGMYVWLGWLQPVEIDLVWKLRSLPALFGVAGVFAIYWLNRIAFSPQMGLVAAACMAVSPFAVYLSQEARHYTLPMLLLSLALLGLIQIQKNFFQGRKINIRVWCFWTIINSIALYVHYFYILALIAQIATLILLLFGQRQKIRLLKKACLALILSTSGIVISYLPWLMTMLSHSSRSETDWLHAPKHIAPFYQTLVNWVLMVILFPVEKQPIINTAISAILMIICGIWIGKQVFQGLNKLLIHEETKFATFTLLSFTICVILELFAIVYLLNKDITVVPRYNFIYYPSFCALLAAGIVYRGNRHREFGKRYEIIGNKYNYFCKQSQSSIFQCYIPIILIVGVISCLFLLFNLVFQKPFQPEIFAKNINQEASIPTMLVVGYSNYQDVALGLSFSLALHQLQEKNNLGINSKYHSKTKLNVQPTELAFFSKEKSFDEVLKKISANISHFISIKIIQQTSTEKPILKTLNLNLWLVAPGLRKRDFPKQIIISSQNTCQQDINKYYRVGVPYQLYRCH
jgi:uncharacterized membrane protein